MVERVGVRVIVEKWDGTVRVYCVVTVVEEGEKVR